MAGVLPLRLDTDTAMEKALLVMVLINMTISLLQQLLQERSRG